ncbi:glycoside hydrolase family 2 protein, partial [Streptomyces sp. NPDC056728]
WLCGPGRPEDESGWLPTRVPGAVLDDLRTAGAVPDPYHGTDSLLAEWVWQRAWLYRRTLDISPLDPGQRALLHFDGVDHDATVLVDGHEVAHHEGMFTPFACDITEHVAGGGRHLLAVVVHPAPPGEPQVGRTDRVRTHKSRMGYGWDFCPRLVHQGIWQPVHLEIAGPLRLGAVSAATDVAPSLDHGTVRVEAALDVSGPGSVHVTVAAPDGSPVASATRSFEARDTRAVLELGLPAPLLWWPNGHGAQPLYTATVTVLDATGAPAGPAAVRRTGFRRLRLVLNPGAPADALPYTLEVNGRRIYTKGWNWVPHDALHGVPRPDRLEHLLRLAAEAHVTLLRVWGGGLIETPGFYERCDRLGLLVWQEFSLSSSGIDSVPAADEAYLALMDREARAIVPTLCHHPALALWGPGNELHDTATATPLDEKTSPVIAVLARAVADLDPGRAWLPGSPSGRAFLNRADLIADDPDAQHDVHGPWEHQGLGAHQALYDTGTCLLHSEFGVEGMANRRTWNALVPPDAHWPTGRDNPVMEHLGAWWNNTPLVVSAFGGRPRDVEDMRRASQYLQYDGLRYAVEANLRRAPRSSGAIPWQFDEPFPNAWCTAAVDHRGDPKPAYHGVRRAYRPAHVCASFPTQAWAGRRHVEARVHAWRPDGPPGPVTSRLVALDGTAVAEAGTDP